MDQLRVCSSHLPSVHCDSSPRSEPRPFQSQPDKTWAVAAEEHKGWKYRENIGFEVPAVIALNRVLLQIWLFHPLICSGLGFNIGTPKKQEIKSFSSLFSTWTPNYQTKERVVSKVQPFLSSAVSFPRSSAQILCFISYVMISKNTYIHPKHPMQK